MAKDREGKFHPKKGKPSGPTRPEGSTGLKNINTSSIEDYMEIAEKYTVGEEQPAPNVHVRHPNRNLDKNEQRTSQKRDNNNEANASQKSKTETFSETRGKSIPMEGLSPFLTKEKLVELAGHRSGMCISAYMPTHKAGVEKNEQTDTISFKNLLQKITNDLRNKGVEMTAIEKLLKPGYDLIRDQKFWLNATDGLAVFMSENQFKYMRLPVSPKEEVMVNNSFYLTPLIPMITARDYFYLLVLSKKQAKLYRADQFGMVYISIPELPRGIDDVVHFEEKDDQKLFRTDTVGAGQGANYHGIGSGKPDEKQNIAMYFDEVDETLYKAILGTENVPLLLAGVEYLIPIYKSVAKYQHIRDDALTGSYEHEDGATLYESALKKMESYFRKRIDKALEMYGDQSATALTSSIPADVVPAAHYSRVWHLFVQKGEHIWGTFDEMKNELSIHNGQEEGDEDLLEKAIIKTIQNGGEVHFVDRDRMPGQSKIAALMRYEA